MPLITVIMPSYNYARFISESIESVLTQSAGDLELLIIDDGSTDKSREIIADFAHKDHRVKALFHSKNEGISKTINDGFDVSSGKYIAITNADDVWAEDKIEQELGVLKNNENLIVWSEGAIIDDRGNDTGKTFTQLHEATQKNKSGMIFDELLKRNFIMFSSILGLRTILTKIRLDTKIKYMNDWLYFVDLAKDHEFYYIDKPLVKYRIHGRNTTADRSGYLLDDINIRNMFCRRYSPYMSKNIKAEQYFEIGRSYKEMGRINLCNYNMFKALTVDTHNKNAKCYLAKVLKNDHPIVYRSLRWLYENIVTKNLHNNS